MAKISSDSFNISKVENVVLEILDKPEITFFITSFNIPGISLGTRPLANPFKEHQEPGNLLTYEELQLTFLVDENFKSWNEIHQWIKEGSNGYTFSTQNITRKNANIIITTNNMNPAYRIGIKNMFPISVASIDIDLQQAEATPITFQSTFVYESYKFENL